MQLDIRTLIFNQMLFTLVFAVALMLVHHNQPFMRGPRWWSAANAAGGGAMLLVVLRGTVPDLLSVLVANALLLLALCFFCTGVAHLRGRPSHQRWLCPLLIAIMVPILAWYTYVDPSVGARIVVVTLINAVPSCMTVWLLVDQVPQRLRIPQWFTAAAFGQHLLIALIRMVYSVVYPPDDLMTPDAMQTLSFLSIFVLLVVSSFGCVWMVTAYLAEELQRQARTDPLTGALNRLALQEGFTRELERARRTARPLSLLLFDLDRFKQLNDRHGHPLGDAALKTVADVVQRELRGTDLLARYGGEEFLALLPNTDKQRAIETAERLRRNVEEQGIAAGENAILTSSFGIATFPEDGEDSAALIASADSLLYLAKQRGRNRVVAFKDRD